MSTRLDQFCDKLRARLDTVEGRLRSVKSSLQALPVQAEEPFGGRIDLDGHQVEPPTKRVDESRARLKTWAQRNMAKTKVVFGAWRARQATRELKARADRAEAYAVGAINFALDAIDEAEELIRDAVAAGIEADSAVRTGSTPTGLLGRNPAWTQFLSRFRNHRSHRSADPRIPHHG
jgi:hypothetical protein